MVSLSPVGQQVSPTGLRASARFMCCCPNIMVGNKFRGSLKKYIKESHYEGSEQEVMEMLKKDRAQIIPCGQCIECRINYARNWAARCEVESYYHQNNHFLTLTYDDEHLPIVNKETGEIYRGLKDPISYYNSGERKEVATLLMRDVQLFLKRLRKWASTHNMYDDPEVGLKIFYCGEYGDKNGRPHYHMIVYGVKIPDLRVEYYKGGYEHDQSDIIRQLWGNGRIEVGSVTYESCQYVAQYVVKKQKGIGAKTYKKKGIAPEFCRMSRRPGIGMRYWEEHKDEIYSVDTIYLKRGKKVKPPKYFDILQDEHELKKEMGEKRYNAVKEYEKAQKKANETKDEEAIILPKMHSIAMQHLKKERRQKANESLFEQLKKTTMGLLEYLDVKAENYVKRHTKCLHRDKDGTDPR